MDFLPLPAFFPMPGAIELLIVGVIGFGMVAVVIAIIVFAVKSGKSSSQSPQPASDDDLVNCPYCGEKIRPNATKCRFCREQLPKDRNDGGHDDPDSQSP